MREKKYIDRLYQEKFKDFEASPGENVWKSISAKLQEQEQAPKKPFIAPLWPRLGGIAALLTFFFLIGEWFLPNESSRIANEDVEDILRTTGPLEENAIATTEDEEYNLLESTGSKEAPFPFRQSNSAVSETSSIKESGVKETEVSPKASILSDGKRQKASQNSFADLNKPSLLEALEFNETTEITDAGIQNRIEVRTHAAPIYYGNFGKGNFLDPSFNHNNSQSEVTYSYGLNISYAISDRVKIRSGVNKVAMSYNTSGVSYQAVINPRAISSISYVERPSNLETPVPKSEYVSTTNRANIGAINTGLLNQRMGFIEVPLEVEYSLISRKFELNLIGGASTFFLDENRISVDSGLFSTTLGPANNINNVSFSTNVGLGLDYNLSEKFKLNLEPMFKYQLKTFSTNSPDSQPYFLGIYSGFSYKF